MNATPTTSSHIGAGDCTVAPSQWNWLWKMIARSQSWDRSIRCRCHWSQISSRSGLSHNFSENSIFRIKRQWHEKLPSGMHGPGNAISVRGRSSRIHCTIFYRWVRLLSLAFSYCCCCCTLLVMLEWCQRLCSAVYRYFVQGSRY